MTLLIDSPAIAATRKWLENVVIGLNLCPFAKLPYKKEQVRFVECSDETQEAIIDTLIAECQFLDKNPSTATTLVIITDALEDFFDYTQFLQWTESRLKQEGWRGVYQIASFHPGYCFAGSEPDDIANLTNRSPYPILHILREEQLSEMIERYPDTEDIPNNNIRTLQEQNKTSILELFHYLFD